MNASFNSFFHPQRELPLVQVAVQEIRGERLVVGRPVPTVVRGAQAVRVHQPVLHEAGEAAVPVMHRVNAQEFRVQPGGVREHMFNQGAMQAQVVEGKEAEGAKFKDYFDFNEPFSSLPSHRILALLRGENEGVLQLQLDAGDDADYEDVIASRFELDRSSKWLADAVHWGWRTKLYISSSLDVRMRLKEVAEEGALKIFATNLRDVLLAAPAGQRATIGLDPGYRNGVKCAVVDKTGKVLDTAIVYPHQPQNQWSQALQTLSTLCAKHSVDLMAIGNGTASRETEKLAQEIADLIKQAGRQRPTPVVVSESGASVYSASQLAAEEFPDMDVSLRGAVSIARRLQDPLAELVKIDPKAIGVGQYQHDISETLLARVQKIAARTFRAASTSSSTPFSRSNRPT